MRVGYFICARTGLFYIRLPKEHGDYCTDKNIIKLIADPYNLTIITADCLYQQQRFILESFWTVHCFGNALKNFHKTILQRANHIAIVFYAANQMCKDIV